MERKISLSDMRNAMYTAYDSFKSVDKGALDSRITDVDTSKFGITLAFANGTIINKGDTDVAAPIGGMVKLPLLTLILEQSPAEKIAEMVGCAKGCAANSATQVKGALGMRLISMLEPTGDPDSKWNLLENRMISLMGSAPNLDVKLYESQTKDINDQVNGLAANDFFLYDDAALSVDLYRRGQAMKATTEQLAIMGATIAADGVNPVTRKIVFDGSLAKNAVGMMAANGPHKMARPWDMITGLPALSSYGGLMLGVYPGVFAIAAYSPLLNDSKISIRAAMAIKTFMQTLDISVFQSAALAVDF